MDLPNLVAHFVLDQDGKPKMIKAGDTKHYWIQLGVAEAPDDAYAVTYRLHDSYYEPVRESREHEVGFRQELTSFGDYTVRADIRTRSRVEPLVTSLSEALERGHSGHRTPEIETALEEIRNH